LAGAKITLRNRTRVIEQSGEDYPVANRLLIIAITIRASAPVAARSFANPTQQPTARLDVPSVAYRTMRQASSATNFGPASAGFFSMVFTTVATKSPTYVLQAG
jgi:hypothetical protein